MTSDDTARPQDAGRKHRARGAPSAETSTLLAEYQEAMRAELRDVLVELRGQVPGAGMVPLAEGESVKPVRPNLTQRMKLWDLGIKLGRELGTEVDARPPARTGPAAATVVPMRRRGRIDYGPE